MIRGADIFDEEVGLLKKATIVGYDDVKKIVKVRLNNTSAIKGNNSVPSEMSIPFALFNSNGMFIGYKPVIGTSVVLGQGSGGQLFFIKEFAENINNYPNVNEGELLIKNLDNKLSMTSTDIMLGADNSRIHINTTIGYVSSNINNSFQFTKAQRSINGIIKRDINYNVNFDQSSRLDSDIYESNLTEVGLDPTFSTNKNISGPQKNPALVENRSIIYEFDPSSDVKDDLNEFLNYKGEGKNNRYAYPNRRKSKTDTLSLSSLFPNHLIESIQGTVVDTFGNVLDINRYPLLIGKDQNTLKKSKGEDKANIYKKIKELHRKGVAFHYEINTKKDFLDNNGEVNFPDINTYENYGRSKSKFFIDVDKEGQFKINVPSSSEKGNIPLLTRYENYSSFGTEDNNNPNKLIYREDNLDIFHESFAAPALNQMTGNLSDIQGSISIINDDIESTPIDRLKNKHIKHGLVYHDLTATCYAHQRKEFLDWQGEEFIPLSNIPILENIIEKTLYTSGEKANAGGRSGQINLDGSLEMILGANTSDRQSLLLDTAGGIVANIGRDKNNRSALLNMNGDFIMQVGGYGVSGDTRFVDNNGHLAGVFDLRIINSGYRVTVLRFDDNGITVMTPGIMRFHSGQGTKITSDAGITLEAELVTVQGRTIQKGFGGSI